MALTEFDDLRWLKTVAMYFRTVDKSGFSPELLNAIDSLNQFFFKEQL